MKKSTLQALRIILLLLPGISFSQTSLPNFPLTVQNQPQEYCAVCSGAKFLNSANVSIIDNLFTTTTLQPNTMCYQDQCYWSRYLDCHNFGFSIPAGAIIKGIQVDVTGFCDKNEAVADKEIYLQKNSNLLGSNMASVNLWPTSIETRTYGGDMELWDYSWNPSDINFTQFGVFIKLKNTTTLVPTVSIDGVSMTVFYQLTTGIYSQTSTSSTFMVNSGNDELNISFDMPDNNKKTELSFYDNLGRKCYAEMINENSGNISRKIETSHLNSGIYLVNITTDNKRYSKKCVIAR
jgi:hypothetical protein